MVDKIKKEIRNRNNIFWFLISGVIISLGLYVYFVSHTIYALVLRQNAEKTIANLEIDISKLEASYLDLKAQITADLARSKGFTDISSATFISRKSLGKNLTMNNEI